MNHQRRLILYTAVSLDGYIATEDDSLDWLFKVEGEGDNGYSKFYDTVDTLLIGKRTYDYIVGHRKTAEFPYKTKTCYVFSKTKLEDYQNVRFVNDNVLSFTEKLKSEDGKDIWLVGGGELLHSFIKEKLVDQLILTIAPTLIGKGIPLFKADNYELELHLLDIRRYNQFAEVHYEFKK